MKLQKKGWFLSAVALLIGLLSIGLAAGFFAPKKTAIASAANSYPYTIHSYDVVAEVTEDRKIIVEEEINVTIHRVGSQQVFYKSLPIEGDRYENIWAQGVDNPDFSYDVADNPDVDGFLDINCHGGVEVGANLTYKFGYTLIVAREDIENGLIIDFVGAGCPVPYQDVTVNITFPAPLTYQKINSSGYGTDRNDYVDILAQTPTSLTLYADILPVVYNDTFGEYCAAPITLTFAVDGGFKSPALGVGLWLTLGLGVAVLAVGILCLVFVKKRREIVTVVNLSAPDKMD
ncbi:MAG: hypothetical protein IJX18_03830, partial [Clostridia bacterium]|nr:hypothetical protein [Clostridia bacterium]